MNFGNFKMECPLVSNSFTVITTQLESSKLQLVVIRFLSFTKLYPSATSQQNQFSCGNKEYTVLRMWKPEKNIFAYVQGKKKGRIERQQDRKAGIRPAECHCYQTFSPLICSNGPPLLSMTWLCQLTTADRGLWNCNIEHHSIACLQTFATLESTLYCQDVSAGSAG